MSRACFALLSFGEQCTERLVSIHFQQPGPTLASTGRGIRARPAPGRAAACNTPTPITHARVAYWLAAREAFNRACQKIVRRYRTHVKTNARRLSRS